METQTRASAQPAPEAISQHDAPSNIDWAPSAVEAIGRHKDNPDYLKRLFDGTKEARREIDAEYLRELDEQARK